MKHLSCEMCGKPIFRDDEEVYRGVTRTLCIWCQEDYENSRQEMADIIGEYKRSKGRE